MAGALARAGVVPGGQNCLSWLWRGLHLWGGVDYEPQRGKIIGREETIPLFSGTLVRKDD